MKKTFNLKIYITILGSLASIIVAVITVTNYLISYDGIKGKVKCE